MNCFASLLLLFALLSGKTNHDVQMTQFELSQQKGTLALTIKVEKMDFFRSWKGFEFLAMNQQKAIINDYLQHNTFWSFNGLPFSLCTYEIQEDNEHFFIRANFENAPLKIVQVRFRNRFLIEEIKGHLNIIHINLNEQRRSFKMDKKRQVITLEYK